MIGRYPILDGDIREHAKLLDVGAAHRIRRSVIESGHDSCGAKRFLNSLLDARELAAPIIYLFGRLSDRFLRSRCCLISCMYPYHLPASLCLTTMMAIKMEATKAIVQKMR